MIVRRTNLDWLAFVQPYAINKKSPALRRHFRLSCHISAPNPCTLGAAMRVEASLPSAIQRRLRARLPIHSTLPRTAHPSPPAERTELLHYRPSPPISEPSRARSNAAAPAPFLLSPARAFPDFAPAPSHAWHRARAHRLSEASAFSTRAPVNQTAHQASRPWQKDSRLP